MRLRSTNNRRNLQSIQNQINDDNYRKSVNNYVDKLYYKPHFGPEETDSVI